MGPVEYDKNQNGGSKGRGPINNWIIMMAIIDEAKRLKKNVYLFFGDLVKCFDRLWLRDCLVDLHQAGVREREIRLIYKLNEKAVFKVVTPVGTTGERTVKEIVKQGTVFGPKLCCASTGKINEGNEMQTTVYPNVQVQALTFVDDIESLGSRNVVQGTISNCVKMEKEKLWEFSTDKSNWMCIQNGKEPVNNIDMSVKQGKLKKVDKYKYLGNVVNEKGNMDAQFELMEKSKLEFPAIFISQL